MKCKYCGYALPKNSPVCPHCKRIMSKDQLEIRKELNGANNPYAERLEKLNYDMYKNKIEENEQHINIKPYVIIILILLAILILSWIL